MLKLYNTRNFAIMARRFFLLVFGVLVFIQPSMAQEEEALDTIYMLGQRKLVVKVQGIFYSNVKYREPGSDEVKSVDTKNIQRVIFDSGRKEVFNPPLVGEITETDWKNVVLTENKEDVNGLYEIGKVTGRSSSSNRTAKSAERTAKIRMKKRTANRGGVMVLVTKKELTGGFGEVPSYYIEGIAYSFEKPSEDSQ